MSVYDNSSGSSSNSKRRSNQIKIVLQSIARPTGKKSTIIHEAMNRRETASPMLTFFSGPGFESRELELDLRDLVGVNIKDLDDSLKDILLDDPKRPGSNDNDDIDNVSIVSEISTCSSAVTVTLEPVDEEPKNTKRARTPSSPTKNMEHWSCPSSSEPEDDEGRKSGRKSKKISNLFSFNSGPANPYPGHSETQLERNSSDRKKRRSSLTKLMSPLALGIFTGLPSTQNFNVTEMRPVDLHDKESRKVSGQNRPSRKLSLTMFQKQSSSDKMETKKRRNTDPNLIQKLKTTSTIVESECEGLTIEGDECSQDRARKVSFNALAPIVQGLAKNDLRVEPEEANFKEEDIKLRDLMGSILRSHMLSMVDYRRETCDRTGKSICKIIKTLVESIKESEGQPSKVACVVYIGAVRDEGIFMSTQALWDSNQDNFAAASFRNDSVFGLSIVIATPYI